MDITVRASDGKEFHGTNYNELVKEVNKYEAELKQKELERQERLRKLEEERKAKEIVREKAMKRVEDCIDLVNQAVKKYEDETGKKLEFVTVNDKLTTREKVYNSTDYLLNIPFWWNKF